MPGRDPNNPVCPRCGAQARHRALWLYLHGRTDLFTRKGLRVLHFAPERALGGALAAAPGLHYVSADLEDPAAMEHFDITAIPHEDGSFDVILCIHVLEHVEDDRAGMRELRRILSPDGFAIVLVPLDLSREQTYEDPTITAPAERERAFWQTDHVRLYGQDFPERLKEAGFQVTVDRWVRTLDPATIQRNGLFPLEDIYVGRTKNQEPRTKN
ncbi:MAG TPA: class I SAM-dependent methyltransferase [Thermoleophilaceae bacterium]|jgi:SAM-dependent methyltransferase